jgi:flavodoxin-like protein
MRRALVVYESMFGNTRSIADAVAEGLSSGVATEIVEVGEAPTSLPEAVSLLVVGGPTHAFGLSRASTRKDAAGRADGRVLSRRRGLREWLAELETRPGLPVATFDTRIAKPRVPGSAARAAERRLRRAGVTIAASGESFYVVGTTGPLLEGELARARSWGEELARSAGIGGAAQQARARPREAP